MGCFIKGELCGVAQIYKPNHLVNLFIDTKYHNLGIGKTLFRTVVEYCKNNGVEHLQLEALRSSLLFCKSTGSIATGDTTNFRGLEYTPMTYKIL